MIMESRETIAKAVDSREKPIDEKIYQV